MKWLIILALVIGVIGMTHDWPMIYGIEGQQIGAAISFAYHPQFDSFCCLTYPPLYFYFLAFIYRLVGFLGQLIQVVANFDDFILLTLANPGIATLIARIIALLAFLLTVLGVYKTTKEIGDYLGGVVAGLLAMTTPSLVFFAKTGQSEMLMVALVIWSIYFSVLLFTKDDSLKNLLMATILASLATCVKYNAALSAMPIVVYLILGKKSLGYWLIVLVTGWGIFLASHPFVPKLVFSRYFFDLLRINPSFALERLVPLEMRMLASAFVVGNFEKQIHANTWLWILHLISSHEGMIIWFCLMGLIGCLFCFNRIVFSLMMVILGYWWWVSQLKAIDNEFHYLLPLYPAVLILTGVGLYKLLSKTRYQTGLFVVFVIAWGYWCLNPLLTDQLHLSKTETTTLAVKWLDSHTDKSQTIVRGHDTPLKLIDPSDSTLIPTFLRSNDLNNLVSQYISQRKILREEVFRFDLPEADWPKDWSEEKIAAAKKEVYLERSYKFGYLTVDELIRRQVKYVVLSQSEIELINRPSGQEIGSDLDYLYKRSQKAYRDFLTDTRVKEVWSIYPDENMRGQLIKIFRID